MTITIGADPEVFIHSISRNHCISAHGLIPGTKKDPFKVPLGAVQIDGVALEYNITPAKTAGEFTAHNLAVLHQLYGMISKNSDLSLLFKPTVHFPQTYFDKEIPEESKILGCDPDYNAYTECINLPPNTSKPMRTGAGHLHIGWTEDSDSSSHFYDCLAITKQLDHSIGFFSYLWDKDTERQELYGRMGSFRPKSYGVEYRALSNAWVKYPKLYPWLFHTVIKAMSDLEKGIRYWEDPDLPFDAVGFPDEFPLNLDKYTLRKKEYGNLRKNMSLLHGLNFKNSLLSKEIHFAQ